MQVSGYMFYIGIEMQSAVAYSGQILWPASSVCNLRLFCVFGRSYGLQVCRQIKIILCVWLFHDSGAQVYS